MKSIWISHSLSNTGQSDTKRFSKEFCAGNINDLWEHFVVNNYLEVFLVQWYYVGNSELHPYCHYTTVQITRSKLNSD